MSGDPPEIPFTRPSTGRAELRALRRALEAGAIGGNGAICRRVQARLAEITGAKHALLTPSATHAMEIALTAFGIGRGDEVLMPSFAFVSQANAILARGARPVFCEIDEATLNLDPEDARRRVTARTRLVMPVHYAGIACDMGALGALARDEGLLLFEDAAQAIGSRWRGRHLGTIGDAGCVSFHVTKNVVCGEGGALYLRRRRDARAAEIIQEKGTNRSAFLRGEVDKYTWVGPGGSYVLSDLLAALLEVQLERMDALTRPRMRVWEAYHRGLARLEERGDLRRPTVPAWAEHNAHIYAFRASELRLQRRLLTRLKERGVHATFHFQPLHASRFAREVLGRTPSLPVTERAAETLVRLPLHAGMTVADAERVVAEVERIARG